MPEPIQILLTVRSEVTFKCVKWKNEYKQFTVRAWDTGLHIGLFASNDTTENSSSTNPKYIIKVATDPTVDSKVALYKEGVNESLVSTSVPYVLDKKEWKGFWVYVSKETISFGKENECEPILSWKEKEIISIEKIGFRVQTYPYLYDDVDERDGEADIVIDSCTKSKPSGVRWAKCFYGQVPENAFVGGYDNDNKVYVIRAMIQNALTPGKLREGTAYSEVSWDCRDHHIAKYEVLADFNGEWVKCVDDKIPPLALLAGRSEDNWPLYVGRTSYEGTLTVGKVQPNHNVLYIPFRGQELAFTEYEILCHKPPGLPFIPHPPINGIVQQQEEKWVYSCNGRVPRNAFVIGDRDQVVVLIRAKYQETWFPGWMCYADGIKGHIAGSYFNMSIEEYEVLCDFKGYWEKRTADFCVPKNALVTGIDREDNNIYVGRAWHKGRLLCGPVINMTCEIPYEGEVTQKEQFDILCHPNYIESAAKNGLDTTRCWDL